MCCSPKIVGWRTINRARRSRKSDLVGCGLRPDRSDPAAPVRPRGLRDGGFGKGAGVNPRVRTYPAISPNGATQTSPYAKALPISRSSTAIREARPVRNGWSVKVKRHPSSRIAANSSRHISSTLAGDSMAASLMPGRKQYCSQSSRLQWIGNSTSEPPDDAAPPEPPTFNS